MINQFNNEHEDNLEELWFIGGNGENNKMKGQDMAELSKIIKQLPKETRTI